MELDKTSSSGFQDVQEIYYIWASADFVIKSVTNPVLMPVYIVHTKTTLYTLFCRSGVVSVVCCQRCNDRNNG